MQLERRVAMLVVLSIISSIFALLVIIGLTSFFLERRIVKDRYEWLEILYSDVWKRTLQIARDMRRLKRTGSGLVIMYFDLAQLEEEGLVEKRDVVEKVYGYNISVAEYRLTRKGLKKLIEKWEIQRAELGIIVA